MMNNMQVFWQKLTINKNGVINPNAKSGRRIPTIALRGENLKSVFKIT